MNEHIKRAFEAVEQLSIPERKALVRLLKDVRIVMPLYNGRHASYDGLGRLKDEWGREDPAVESVDWRN